jgi:hypothetical protein
LYAVGNFKIQGDHLTAGGNGVIKVILGAVGAAVATGVSIFQAEPA